MLLNLVSVRLQRSVSLFVLSGDSPVLLTGNGSRASLFCLYFSYSVNFGKTNTVVLGCYLYVRVPLDIL